MNHTQKYWLVQTAAALTVVGILSYVIYNLTK